MTTALEARGPRQLVTGSRAINVDADRERVLAMCLKHKAAISAIESLPSGGTRVVMMNGDDAAIITKAFGSKVLPAGVMRTHWMKAR